ncbi:MAG: hypothetical protein KA747_06520, partial [Ignavibacteriaceae bacterium]|nr:hypothetical protein [Ignavibacteriaceae bacterium]
VNIFCHREYRVQGGVSFCRRQSGRLPLLTLTLKIRENPLYPHSIPFKSLTLFKHFLGDIFSNA